MSLCTERHPCVPGKPYKIHSGTEAVLLRYQRPSKALPHLSAEHVCLFVDHLYFLHNFSKERARLNPTFRLAGIGWERHYGAKLCVGGGCGDNCH